MMKENARKLLQYDEMFLFLCLLVTCVYSEPIEQPSAYDLYPPTIVGHLPVVVDHFRYSLPVRTFDIQYLGTDVFASAGRKSPVLMYCGNEGEIEDFYNATGGMFELAEEIGAYVIFVEHRYYGDSLPFGNESFTNENLVYLSIEQALADFSVVISSFPDILGCQGSQASDALCDVILFGGSYGGMLAAWHRLKYPHLSTGAIASGAPIDFYPGTEIQTSFYNAFIATFQDYGGITDCGIQLDNALKIVSNSSISDLEAAGVLPCGGFDVSNTNNIVEQFTFYAAGAVSSLAMVDYPYPCGFMSPLPANPVQYACELLSGSDDSDVDVIRSLLQVVLFYVNGTKDLPCLDLDSELVGHSNSQMKKKPQSTDLGVISWNYQACTELLMEPITSDGYGFYPPGNPKQSNEIAQQCAKLFNVEPRPYWMPKAFGRGSYYSSTNGLSNVLFIENSKDPWHVGTSTVTNGGVDGSVVRFLAQGGAHHQDLRFSSEYDAIDVHRARELALSTVKQWLNLS